MHPCTPLLWISYESNLFGNKLCWGISCPQQPWKRRIPAPNSQLPRIRFHLSYNDKMKDDSQQTNPKQKQIPPWNESYLSCFIHARVPLFRGKTLSFPLSSPSPYLSPTKWIPSPRSQEASSFYNNTSFEMCKISTMVCIVHCSVSSQPTPSQAWYDSPNPRPETSNPKP